jgi:hypothetical protein
VIIALLALGGVVASVSWAERPSSHGRRPPHRPQSSVPANGQRLHYASRIHGTCLTSDHARVNAMRGWGVYTFDPGRASAIGPAGRELLPTRFSPGAGPPGLDPYASGSTQPADATQWQVAFVARQMPSSPRARCADSMAVAAPDAHRAGSSVVLRRPGPYVYWTFEHTVHWIRVNAGTPEPTPRPCAQDPNQSATSPAPTGAPPSVGGHGWHWAVSTFCTTVKWWTFSVLGPRGQCARPGYVNQYVAGVRLQLPLGRGKAGGNACGPSALLMAMQQSVRSGAQSRDLDRLPSLEEVFDQTMSLPRAQVQPNSFNEFVGGKAAELLRTLGWRNAVIGRLGTTAESIANERDDGSFDPSNAAALDRALDRGPVVLSTDLGREPWGTTGDGHMIVVLGRDPVDPDEYIVYDPAGNYFSDPDDHYGPGSCGAGVLYPRSWLLASIPGSWFIELGEPPAHISS